MYTYYNILSRVSFAFKSLEILCSPLYVVTFNILVAKCKKSVDKVILFRCNDDTKCWLIVSYTLLNKYSLNIHS